MFTAPEKIWRIVASASVKMLPTVESGKQASIYIGYRPNHKLPNGVFCMGLFSDITSISISPGATSLVKIVFGVLAPHHELFAAGMHWDINEGGTKVGEGEVIAIFEKTLVT